MRKWTSLRHCCVLKYRLALSTGVAWSPAQNFPSRRPTTPLVGDSRGTRRHGAKVNALRVDLLLVNRLTGTVSVNSGRVCYYWYTVRSRQIAQDRPPAQPKLDAKHHFRGCVIPNVALKQWIGRRRTRSLDGVKAAAATDCARLSCFPSCKREIRRACLSACILRWAVGSHYTKK